MKSFGHVGGYLQGHPLMRVETSHTFSGTTNSCCGITGPPRIRIANMLKRGWIQCTRTKTNDDVEMMKGPKGDPKNMSMKWYLMTEIDTDKNKDGG